MFLQRDIDAVVNVLKSGNLHMGALVTEFEKEFARYCGVKHAVAVSSGAAGMHIALMAAGIGHKEEVIVPPLCPVAGPNAVFYQGAVNIFADIDPATGNIDPLDICQKINSNTKAVIIHHYSGMPCNIEPILNAVKDRDVSIITDASTALGAKYAGHPISHFGDITVFNFGESEHIYTGEGGMVVTNSDELVGWIKLFRNEGFVKEKEQLTKDEGPMYKEMQDLGYAYRMTEMQAALGLSQLNRIDEILNKREKLSDYYDDFFGDLEDLIVPIHKEQTNEQEYTSAKGFYAVKFISVKLIKNRKELLKRLYANGIKADARYYPVFLYPYYLWAGHPDICTLEGSRAPKAEMFYQQVLTLSLEEHIVDDLDNFTERVKTTKRILLEIGKFSTI